MTGRHDYVLPDPPKPAAPVAHYLNRNWQYVPAAAHGDSLAFAARQRERMEQAQRERKQ